MKSTPSWTSRYLAAASGIGQPTRRLAARTRQPNPCSSSCFCSAEIGNYVALESRLRRAARRQGQGCVRQRGTVPQDCRQTSDIFIVIVIMLVRGLSDRLQYGKAESDPHRSQTRIGVSGV